MKLLIVAGTRPNFMKIASLVHALDKFPNIIYKIAHTGQHYDKNLSNIFFNELNIPKPDINLGVGSGTREFQLKTVERLLIPVIRNFSPDIVIVVGDVNSTLAAARAAKKVKIKVAHVEAGLRSFDMKMPEERNRIEIDKIADYLFVTEKSGVKNLVNSNVAKEKIHFVGNTMIDTLIDNMKKIEERDTLKNLKLENGEYAVSTVHRESNTETKGALEKILNVWKGTQKLIKVVIPLHPRTKKALERHGLMKDLENINDVVLIPAQGYHDFIHLIKYSKMILTDSGGIQEEATFLGVPCITLRENTERPSTIEIGTNVLVGTDEKAIFGYVQDIMAGNYKKDSKIPDLWDGQAGKRIIKILANEYK